MLDRFTGPQMLMAAAVVQGTYYLFTGLWAIVDITSFQIVTGPKTDLWLVRTVAILVIVAGLVLLLAAYRRNLSAEILLLAVGSAIGLAIIDVVYVAMKVIAPIYLLDALIQVFLAALWLFGWWREHNYVRS
jgi:hypothetical protein